MFIGLWQSGIIVAAIALVLLGLFVIPRKRRMIETLFGVNYPDDDNGLELSSGHSNPQLALAQRVGETAFAADYDLLGDSGGAEDNRETVRPEAVRTKRNLMLRASRSWHVGNATPASTSTSEPVINLLQAKPIWIGQAKQASGRNPLII